MVPPSDAQAHFPNSFPPEVVFQESWRTYQQHILSSLDEYLDDKRLHIVAAPGAGKTVLGLELARRLNKPALILSPTLTIRDQWVQRFVELFLPPDQRKKPEWVCTDIRDPRFLTVTTYRAIHRLCPADHGNRGLISPLWHCGGPRRH